MRKAIVRRLLSLVIVPASATTSAPIVHSTWNRPWSHKRIHHRITGSAQCTDIGYGLLADCESLGTRAAASEFTANKYDVYRGAIMSWRT